MNEEVIDLQKRVARLEEQVRSLQHDRRRNDMYPEPGTAPDTLAEFRDWFQGFQMPMAHTRLRDALNNRHKSAGDRLIRQMLEKNVLEAVPVRRLANGRYLIKEAYYLYGQAPVESVWTKEELADAVIESVRRGKEKGANSTPEAAAFYCKCPAAQHKEAVEVCKQLIGTGELLQNRLGYLSIPEV